LAVTFVKRGWCEPAPALQRAKKTLLCTSMYSAFLKLLLIQISGVSQEDAT